MASPGHDDEEEKGATTIATFSGMVGRDSIDLPTTLVSAKAAPTAFRRRARQ